LAQAIEHAVDWHAAWRSGANMRDYTLLQIEAYETAGAGSDHAL